MHEVQADRLGGLSLPKKSVARLNDHPEMTIAVYRGREATQQQRSRDWSLFGSCLTGEKKADSIARAT